MNIKHCHGYHRLMPFLYKSIYIKAKKNDDQLKSYDEKSSLQMSVQTSIHSFLHSEFKLMNLISPILI